MRRDKMLQNALARSKKAGDFLLKSEDAELQAVEAQAKQLLQNEYR